MRRAKGSAVQHADLRVSDRTSGRGIRLTGYDRHRPQHIPLPKLSTNLLGATPTLITFGVDCLYSTADDEKQVVRNLAFAEQYIPRLKFRPLKLHHHCDFRVRLEITEQLAPVNC
jgi:hypothetical protein